MARYENSKIKTNIIKRGKYKSKVYNITSNSTTVYSSIPEEDGDIYVITQYGDRLDQLAHQYYGNVNLWWYIAKANGLSFITLPPGTRLRIPATTQYAIGR
jgi:nucleoid-associated protein YgaU